MASSLGPVFDRLSALARGTAGLELLLLIGSRARGDAHQHSDWDLAYLAAPSLDPLDLTSRMVDIVGTDRVDLVDLRRASGLLRFRAAVDGLTVFAATEGVDVAFRLEAATFWIDNAAVFERGYGDVLAEVSR